MSRGILRKLPGHWAWQNCEADGPMNESEQHFIKPQGHKSTSALSSRFYFPSDFLKTEYHKYLHFKYPSIHFSGGMFGLVTNNY